VWLNSGASKRRTDWLPKCSPTVAATQLSWLSGNHYWCYRTIALAVPARSRLASDQSRDGHNLRTFGRDVSPPRIIFASSHDQTRLGRRPNESRESRNATRATSPHYLKCSIRAITLPRLCAPKITTPDINRIQSGSRHFCAAGTFCTRFRHDDAARGIRAISGNVFHRQDETTSYAICRGRFDRRRKPPMR
jgi:hypothetical protein